MCEYKYAHHYSAEFAINHLERNRTAKKNLSTSFDNIGAGSLNACAEKRISLPKGFMSIKRTYISQQTDKPGAGF